MKTHNEDRDKLVSKRIAMHLRILGFNKMVPECFVIDDNGTGEIMDAYTGLIPDDLKFWAYRPTVNYAQTWIRENYDVRIFVGWRPNIKKYDCHYFSLELSGPEYVKERTMEEFKNDPVFDDYDDALEAGILRFLEEEIKKNYNI